MTKCCEGITDHMFDCEKYVGIDAEKHDAMLIIQEPYRVTLRYQVTSEQLRKKALAAQNGSSSYSG